MDKFFWQKRFKTIPSSSTTIKERKHWYTTFTNLFWAIEQHSPDKLTVLTNYNAPTVYEFISDCSTYNRESFISAKLLYRYFGAASYNPAKGWHQYIAPYLPNINLASEYLRKLTL